MDFKKIITNLIEFNTMIQGWIDDYNCNNLYDENKSVDWNEGAYNSLIRLQEELSDFGLYFEEDDFDEDYLNNLNALYND